MAERQKEASLILKEAAQNIMLCFFTSYTGYQDAAEKVPELKVIPSALANSPEICQMLAYIHWFESLKAG